MNKYRNVKVELDGYKFDSKAEANRYCELKAMQSQGLIEQLEVHPVYHLFVTSEAEISPSAWRRTKVGKYVGDFAYVHKVNGRWTRVTEDVKGMKTAVYNLKKKLMRACLGIEVIEIGKQKGVKRRTR